MAFSADFSAAPGSGHAAEVERTCSDLGIDFYQLVTSQPLEMALFDVLQSRQHAGRSARAGSRAAAAPVKR